MSQKCRFPDNKYLSLSIPPCYVPAKSSGNFLARKTESYASQNVSSHPAERLKSLSKSLEGAFNKAVVAVTPPADKVTIRSVRTIEKYLAASDVLKQADPPDDGQAYTMWECIHMLKDDGKLSGTTIGEFYTACTKQRKPHPPLILSSRRTLRRRFNLYIMKGMVPFPGDFGITMGAPNKISPDKRNNEINSHIMSSTGQIETLKDTARKIQIVQIESLKAQGASDSSTLVKPPAASTIKYYHELAANDTNVSLTKVATSWSKNRRRQTASTSVRNCLSQVCMVAVSQFDPGEWTPPEKSSTGSLMLWKIVCEAMGCNMKPKDNEGRSCEYNSPQSNFAAQDSC
jgi:hypothetical protein